MKNTLDSRSVDWLGQSLRLQVADRGHRRITPSQAREREGSVQAEASTALMAQQTRISYRIGAASADMPSAHTIRKNAATPRPRIFAIVATPVADDR